MDYKKEDVKLEMDFLPLPKGMMVATPPRPYNITMTHIPTGMTIFIPYQALNYSDIRNIHAAHEMMEFAVLSLPNVPEYKRILEW